MTIVDVLISQRDMIAICCSVSFFFGICWGVIGTIILTDKAKVD